MILPKYKEWLANEVVKRSVFTNKVDEMERKIDAHTERVVEMVKTNWQKTVVT